MFKNNKGFSLIELMVVVAIIAILSTIAIPSYQTFQAKARQKEGFSLMGGYFQAAQASRAEYTFFPGEFVGTGFAPNGTVNYEVVAMDFGANSLPYMQVEDDACVNLSAAMCDCGGACATFKEWVIGTMGAVGMIGWATPATAPTIMSDSFLIASAAFVSTKAAMQDEYTMDHQKTISMVTDGLK